MGQRYTQEATKQTKESAKIRIEVLATKRRIDRQTLLPGKSGNHPPEQPKPNRGVNRHHNTNLLTPR